MEQHKEERITTTTESIATATVETSSTNASKVLERSESKGVLGSVWSAAGAIAETVQQAVQGTLFVDIILLRVLKFFSIIGTIDAAYHTADKLQHDAETVTTVGGYLAHKVADKASSVYEKTVQSAESVLEAAIPAKKGTAN